MSRQPSEEVINRLVSIGLTIEATDNNGRNAALIAAQRSTSVDYIPFLESLGVTLDAIDSDGRGILLNAAYRNTNLDVIQSLASQKQWRKAKDNDKQNAIHVAAYRNSNVDVLKYFVDAGVNANKTDVLGNTPLIIASQRNTPEVIEYLLEQNNKASAENDQKQSALLIAVTRNANNDKRLAENHRIVSTLLSAGAEAAGIDSSGNSALHLAIRAQQAPSIIKQLLEAGAPVDQVNSEGFTALMQAALVAKNSESVELLLEHQANTDIADDFGDTAKVLAQDNPHLVNTKALALLLKATH
jgi:ankyrin repeat protein